MQVSTTEAESLLQELASELGHPPNRAEINLYSEYTAENILSHFDSLQAAYAAADIQQTRSLRPAAPITGEVKIDRPEVPSHTELLQSIHLTGKTTAGIPSAEEIEQSDLYDPEDYQAQFGSVSNAIDIAIDAAQGEFLGKSEIIDYLSWLSDILKRNPYPYDMYCMGEPAYKVALRFDSWKAGLRAAGIDRDAGFSASTQELLSYLQLAANHEDRPPTPTDISSNTGYCPSAFVRRFGSWEAALVAAGVADNSVRLPTELDWGESLTYRRLGLDPNLDSQLRGDERMKIEPYLHDDLHRLGGELNHPPRPKDVEKFGQYPVELYLDMFGPWPDVLTAAGIDWEGIVDAPPVSISEATLEATISFLAALIEAEPSVHEINCFTQYSALTFISYYGSIDDAIEQSRINRDGFSEWPSSETFSEEESEQAKIYDRFKPDRVPGTRKSILHQ